MQVLAIDGRSLVDVVATAVPEDLASLRGPKRLVVLLGSKCDADGVAQERFARNRKIATFFGLSCMQHADPFDRRAWAAAADIQQAVRQSVAPSLAKRRTDFRHSRETSCRKMLGILLSHCFVASHAIRRDALRDERRRFAFREALQAGGFVPFVIFKDVFRWLTCL